MPRERYDFPFTRVTASVIPGVGMMVQWWCSVSFDFPTSTPEFFVEYAAATDSWTRLNPDTPVVDNCVFYTQEVPRCTSPANVYVRVVVDVPDSDPLVSRPEKIQGELTDREYAISRDIIRKEYLRLNKYAGTRGTLLKRRTHGQRCPVCTDWDSENSPLNSACPVCYGTGYAGGYYSGISYPVDVSPTASARDVNQPFGMTDERSRQGRGVAYPVVETYDMWVQDGTGVRHIIRGVQPVAVLQTVDLVYMLTMQELPYSAVEYKVPLVAEDPVPGDTREGWRPGISYTVD